MRKRGRISEIRVCADMRPTGPIIMDINMQYIRAQCGRALAGGKELEVWPDCGFWGIKLTPKGGISASDVGKEGTLSLRRSEFN